MKLASVGDLLYCTYANLAMAHAAVVDKKEKYTMVHYMIRARLFKGLRDGKMNIGSLVEEERIKMLLPLACCYCGNNASLSLDHLIPRNAGGPDVGDNIVWACRSCNSSKSDRDMMAWYAVNERFPALLLLRRYLKLCLGLAKERNALVAPLDAAPELPFSLTTIPINFPKPSQLRLWIVDLA